MDPKAHAVQLVQNIMKSWNVKEEDAKDKNQENLWWFIQGSANFHIQVFQFDKGNEKKDAIEIGATIMPLPTDKEKLFSLYAHVLDMNNTAVNVWFGIRNDKLMLFSTREVAGLDEVELRTAVDDVRFYADYFDDIFKEQYGKSDRTPGS